MNGYQNKFKPYGNKVNSGAAAGLERKERNINKLVDRKEQSMAEFAIRRDAAMFASVTGSFDYRKAHPETLRSPREFLENEYQYWTEFFQNIYLPPEKSTDELLEEVAPQQTPIKVEEKDNLLP